MYTIAHRTNALTLVWLLACVQSVYSQEDVAETKATATIDKTPISEPPITPEDRTHWAFRPIRTPPLPSIQNPQSKIQNQIDAFIVGKLKAKDLELSLPANRPTLL